MALSLAKIYTDLCQCCARPRDNCKQIKPDRRPSSAEGDAIVVNRFAALNVGDPKEDATCYTEERSRCGQYEDDLRETRVVHSDVKANTPQLVDDPLGDAFELHKEIQVSFPHTLTLCPHTDQESNRR